LALRDEEHRPLPRDLDYATVAGLRAEAKQVLGRFRPATLGQASRLAGINPADVMLLRVVTASSREEQPEAAASSRSSGPGTKR